MNASTPQVFSCSCLPFDGNEAAEGSKPNNIAICGMTEDVEGENLENMVDCLQFYPGCLRYFLGYRPCSDASGASGCLLG